MSISFQSRTNVPLTQSILARATPVNSAITSATSAIRNLRKSGIRGVSSGRPHCLADMPSPLVRHATGAPTLAATSFKRTNEGLSEVAGVSGSWILSMA